MTPSLYKNVYVQGEKYRAMITANKKRIDLGYFDCQHEAVKAVILAKEKHFKPARMKLNKELTTLSKVYLKKADKIELQKILGIKQSAIYAAIRGERDLEPDQIDKIQKYLQTKLDSMGVSQNKKK